MQTPQVPPLDGMAPLGVKPHNHDDIWPERGSLLYHQAWGALIATGRNPADGWMLMHGTPAVAPGGYRWAFKNHSLCEPSMASDPAYDGRTKYVHLPEVTA